MTREQKLQLLGNVRLEAKAHRDTATIEHGAAKVKCEPLVWSSAEHYVEIANRCADDKDYLASLIEADLKKDEVKA